MRLNGRGIVSADQPDFTLSESSPHPAIQLCSTTNTKRETPTKEKSVENRQGILVCDRKENLVVTGHVQHVSEQTACPVMSV